MPFNHDYNTPQKGTTDWHTPLNENFNVLDTDVEIRGVESDRDSYEPKANSKFLATDTGAVYLGDGSDWNQIGSIQQGSAEGTHVREVTSGAELQSALENYDTVRLCGTVSIDSTVTVPENTTLYGFGRYSFNSDDVIGDGIKADLNAPLLRCEYTSRVLGLALYNGSSDGEVIHCPKGTNWLRNLDIFTANVGIRCHNDGTGSGAAVETLIDNSRITGPASVTGSIGVEISNFTDVEVRNSQLRLLDTGIYADEGTVRVFQNHFYCGYDTVGQTNLEITENAPYVEVKDNYFEGRVDDLIWCKNHWRCKFDDNLFRILVEGGNGLHFDFGGRDWGVDLDGCSVTRNEFSARGVTANAAINGTNISGVKKGTQIQDNVIDEAGFSARSLRTRAETAVTFDGDGSTTQFTWTHGLADVPEIINVTPKSADAVGDFYVVTDATTATIHFTSPPPSGTANLTYSIEVDVGA